MLAHDTAFKTFALMVSVRLIPEVNPQHPDKQPIIRRNIIGRLLSPFISYHGFTKQDDSFKQTAKSVLQYYIFLQEQPMDNALKNVILLCSLPAGEQILWLDGLPNDWGLPNFAVTPRTNDLFAIIYGSRMLFEQFLFSYERSAQAGDLANELNWLLQTLCSLDDKSLWTRQGLKKSIAWCLVRRLSRDLIAALGCQDTNLDISKKDLVEICDIEDSE